MTYHAAIDELKCANPGYRVGRTCGVGSRYRRQMEGLDFQPATGGSSGGRRFEATGPKGGKHYIGVYERDRLITCGPKGG
jgi:hypothetical protein